MMKEDKNEGISEKVSYLQGLYEDLMSVILVQWENLIRIAASNGRSG